MCDAPKGARAVIILRGIFQGVAAKGTPWSVLIRVIRAPFVWYTVLVKVTDTRQQHGGDCYAVAA